MTAFLMENVGCFLIILKLSVFGFVYFRLLLIEDDNFSKYLYNYKGECDKDRGLMIWEFGLLC